MLYKEEQSGVEGRYEKTKQKTNTGPLRSLIGHNTGVGVRTH